MLDEISHVCSSQIPALFLQANACRLCRLIGNYWQYLYYTSTPLASLIPTSSACVFSKTVHPQLLASTVCTRLRAHPRGSTIKLSIKSSQVALSGRYGKDYVLIRKGLRPFGHVSSKPHHPTPFSLTATNRLVVISSPQDSGTV